MKYPRRSEMDTPSFAPRRLGSGTSFLLGVVIALFGSRPSTAAPAFDLDQVAAKAKELAKEPFKDVRGTVPKWLIDLNYDQWRDIRLPPQKSLSPERKEPRLPVPVFPPG